MLRTNAFRTLSRERLAIIALWVVLVGASWSLPVLSYIETERERAKVESGMYYVPKMPPEWYVTAPDARAD